MKDFVRFLDDIPTVFVAAISVITALAAIFGDYPLPVQTLMAIVSVLYATWTVLRLWRRKSAS